MFKSLKTEAPSYINSCVACHTETEGNKKALISGSDPGLLGPQKTEDYEDSDGKALFKRSNNP